MQDRARFFVEFIRRPYQTASITPSSSHLAEAMTRGLGLDRATSVLELGPGTGVFTEVIVRALNPSARLRCFEINADLARGVATRFPTAHVINDSAENLAAHVSPGEGIDAVVSGLPWVIMSGDQQRRLLEPSVRALRKGGLFATFAYSHAAWLPAGRRLKRLLESLFDRVDVSETIWRNVPPAFVYRCRK
jgi:phosphatidylethanolamine/phosphatidyl-N-methylethanolamine N-methyltransferase